VTPPHDITVTTWQLQQNTQRSDLSRHTATYLIMQKWPLSNLLYA